MDALFLNDDRHSNNIAVLECDGKYDYCPIFDNGAGLLSNIRIVSMDIEPKALIVAQRAYEMNSKAITTTDEMMQTANNLKR